MISNVYLFQPQFPVKLKNTVNYWLPYSAACIWSYVHLYPELTDRFDLKELYFKRENYQKVLDHLENPKVVGFSCYLWNEQYCLKLAKLIKQKYQDCVIVVGGPQAGIEMEKHEFIDSVIMGEGEQPFVDILKSIAFHSPIKKLYNRSRLENLDIPSPYTLGIFDKIIEQNKDLKWATTIETNRGCPYACTFCDWGGVTYSKVKKFEIDRIEAELKWISNNQVEYLFVADANFGIFKQRDLEIVKLIKKYFDVEQSFLEAINLQYSKNNIDWIFEIGKELGKYNRGITVSVQSMNPPTLEAIKRLNLETNDLSSILSLGEKYNVPTYTEIILGLPLETIDSWKDGIGEILSLGQHQSIMISFLELLKNSELNLTKFQYGIKSIKAEQQYEDDGTDKEIIEIVNQTSTMTTDEMVECFIYGWVVNHSHMSGYTQILSRYAFEFEKISFRIFYDRFFDKIVNNVNFKDFLKSFSRSINNYLRNGRFVFDEDSPKSFQSLYFLGYDFFYDNRKELFMLGAEVLTELGAKDIEQLSILQRHFIWDKEFNYPLYIDTNIDIRNWKKQDVRLKFTNKLSALEDIDFYATRYKNLIKNDLEIIPRDS